MRPAPRPPVPPGGKAAPSTRRASPNLDAACAGGSPVAPTSRAGGRSQPPHDGQASAFPTATHSARAKRRPRVGARISPRGALFASPSARAVPAGAGVPRSRRLRSGRREPALLGPGVTRRHVLEVNSPREDQRRGEGRQRAGGIRPPGTKAIRPQPRPPAEHPPAPHANRARARAQ